MHIFYISKLDSRFSSFFDEVYMDSNAAILGNINQHYWTATNSDIYSETLTTFLPIPDIKLDCQYLYITVGTDYYSISGYTANDKYFNQKCETVTDAINWMFKKYGRGANNGQNQRNFHKGA